jgi:hypothetical protein
MKGNLSVFCLCMLSLLVSCKERQRFVGPEALIVNSAEVVGGDLVTLNLSGYVKCATCASATSAMIIEIHSPLGFAPNPIAQAPFPQVGAYEIKTRVRYEEKLEVVARIFTDGGVVVTLPSVLYVTDDRELGAVYEELDLLSE